jgi:outer membrane protein assembly factor BamB
MGRRVTGISLAMILVLAAAGWAEDWPTYRHDNRRSGTTPERLEPEALQEQWAYQPALPPQPAWHGPAKWDAFAGIDNLRSMRNYDPCYFVVTAGDSVYFSSSAEDAVFCVDAATGAEKWSFTADGPVRMPPTIHEDMVHFGADDGAAYGLKAGDGTLVWRYKPVEMDRNLPNDGKLISLYPCRTGVIIEEGIAYFAMALLPWEKAYLCAVDAATGKCEGPGSYRMELDGVTMEGALLASANRLYVPQGRTSPLMFDRKDGTSLGVIKEAGGVFAILTPDNKLVSGPKSQKESFLALNDPDTQDKVASYDRGNFMIVTGDRAFILRDNDLMAVDRATGQTVWTVACDCPYTLIMAGDVLWAGGDRKVVAFAAADGKELRTLPAAGRAYGLAAANRRLYVSTDTGAIHCWK